jgi:NAD-dependent DNA ligase
VQVPAAPEEIGEERPVVDVVDVAAIAEKKAGVERVRAENAAARRAAEDSARHAEQMQLDASKAVEEVLRLEGRLAAQEAAERIRSHGGTFHNSVGKDTTYLVAGGKVGASKLKKAQAYGVTVIDESAFLSLLTQ